MSTPLDNRLRDRLHDLDRAGSTRHPPSISNRRDVSYDLDGRRCIGFCSNDYLGLADATSASPPTPHLPSGAGASRLICGDLPEHRDIERRLARLVHADDAILFPSGYQLNVGVLPTLFETSDVVFSDTLNHASLIDGLRLAPIRPTLLEHGRAPSSLALADHALTWWVCESIFSMDGDRTDAHLLRAHLDRGGCLYLDEAHALGLFPGGAGYASHNGISPTATVGTLGKALGCAGAFLAGSRTLCDWVRAHARSFVFSTGFAPALVPRLAAAIDIVAGPDGDRRRERLWSNVRRLADRLRIPDPPSPIFPLLVGENDEVLAIADSLLARGWHAHPIRPPTVPPGTARLRVTVTAAHTPEQIDAFARDVLTTFASHRRHVLIERGRTHPLVSAPPPAMLSLSR